VGAPGTDASDTDASDTGAPAPEEEAERTG
jgi:hypothetical protein